MANRNDRSEQILRTAMHLFHERGFDGVGVDLIGEKAGVSGPAIYRYFSGKDEILMTLLDEAIDRVLMSTGGQFDDPREELEHLVRGHVQRALEERELMSVWTRERNSIPAAYRSRLSARIKRYIDRWVDCLHACYPNQSRDVLNAAVHATHGPIHSTSMWPESRCGPPASLTCWPGSPCKVWSGWAATRRAPRPSRRAFVKRNFRPSELT